MRETCPQKRAFTLIEVLISLLLVVLFASTLSFGFLRYYRQMALKNAQERVERLFSQADYLSTVLQQEAKVIIIRKNAAWYAILKPWGDEEIEAIDLLGTLPANFVELSGTKTIRLNDTELSELSLLFLPMKGIDLSYVEAKDSMERLLTARELGLVSTNRVDISASLALEGTGRGLNEVVDLRPYARLTTHISIPQEYQDLDL